MGGFWGALGGCMDWEGGLLGVHGEQWGGGVGGILEVSGMYGGLWGGGGDPKQVSGVCCGGMGWEGGGGVGAIWGSRWGGFLEVICGAGLGGGVS